MMRTANPAFRGGIFDITATDEKTMTINGTVGKTAILLAFIAASGYWTWNIFSNEADPAIGAQKVMPMLIGGLIGGLIFGIITHFKLTWAPVTAPLYALCEGLLLGAISAMFNKQYPGIALQAIVLTMGTLAVLLVAYRSGLIKATENFKLGVVAATGGIFILYFISFIVNIFGGTVPFISGNGPLSIGLSVVIVIIAALNLVLDFDFIEHAAETNTPKYMEWYGAFALTVTLVWLYLEILRLLAKLQSRK
ncbi:MAG: Bax inhibitor-1/YccA family protein [Planctomycetes bacterium]|nr:Bax inhibitor-1/YccA family protein [Planctomycetota bacterium]